MKTKNVSAPPRPLFPLGEIGITPGALGRLVEHGLLPANLLIRHQSGDWGDLEEFDKHQNQFSIRAGLRILSSYLINNSEKVYVITEADRSSTTILMPEEY
jgi:hypothetical protein